MAAMVYHKRRIERKAFKNHGFGAKFQPYAGFYAMIKHGRVTYNMMWVPWLGISLGFEVPGGVDTVVLEFPKELPPWNYTEETDEDEGEGVDPT